MPRERGLGEEVTRILFASHFVEGKVASSDPLLNPEVLKYIPKNEFYNMTTLFEKLIDKDKNIISYLLDGYWLDIGRFEEYKKANEEYNEVF